VVWEKPGVVKLPTSALVRDGDHWAVYTIDQGRARRVTVAVEHQTAQDAEILSGLAEGTRVIVHPSDAVVDGARVVERTGA
jgi:HlyD family secretion protein